MKRLIIIGLLCSFPATSMANSEAMLKKAEQSRRAAEEKLGRDRLQRTNERVEWTQKMQTLHAQLAKVEAGVEAATSDKQKLKADLSRIEKNKAMTSRRIDSLSYALRRAAGYPNSSTNLDDLESFGQAIAGGLTARLEKVQANTKFRVERADVLDRTGAPKKLTLVRLGNARTIAVNDANTSSGLVRKTEDQQWLIDGVELEPIHQAMLVKFEQGQVPTHIPVDIDGSLGQQNRGSANSASWLEQGGSFVWPIVFVGFLGLLLLLERITYLFFRKARSSTITAVKRALGSGQIERAQDLVKSGHTDLDRLLLRGIETIKEPMVSRESALEEVLLAEEPRLERSLTLLAAAAGVAPLLGLLGTVTGMIGTFDVIAQHGTGNPRLLSGGISMALITTQLGLIVAVPLLLGHAWVSRAVEKRQALLEEARTAILGLRSSEEPKA